MPLFTRIPQRFFTILTSTKKELYVEALFVLRQAFKTELVIRREELTAMLVNSLESSILQADFSEEVQEMGAEGMLSRILEPLRDQYDYIILDTCPSLGALTINALAAADEVIITVNPQLLAMMGLQDFLKTVRKIRSRINNRLSVAGILLTMCDSRTNLCKVISEEVAETFQGQIRIFESRIPTTVKVGESVYYSEPLIEYAPGNGACEAYRMLAKEVACA